MFAVFDDDRFDTSSILVTTYKLEWAAEYVNEGFSQLDPVYNEVAKAVGPVDWLDFRGRNERMDYFFQRFFAVNGGSHGISFPTSRPTSVSAVASMVFDVADEKWNSFKAGNMAQLSHIANVMVNRVLKIHEWTAHETPRLTQRETECLHWAALGKSDAEIGMILGIARWTVVAHIQSAKYKLDCFNKTAAVAKAVGLGLVKPTGASSATN